MRYTKWAFISLNLSSYEYFRTKPRIGAVFDNRLDWRKWTNTVADLIDMRKKVIIFCRQVIKKWKKKRRKRKKIIQKEGRWGCRQGKMGRKKEHNRHVWVVGPAAGENKMEEDNR
jgi:hypothetical protein